MNLFFPLIFQPLCLVFLASLILARRKLGKIHVYLCCMDAVVFLENNKLFMIAQIFYIYSIFLCITKKEEINEVKEKKLKDKVLSSCIVIKVLNIVYYFFSILSYQNINKIIKKQDNFFYCLTLLHVNCI